MPHVRHAARASITYKIKAACDQAGLLKPDIKSSASFEVLQHSKGPPPQPVVLADEKAISYLCCLNKGVIRLAMQADCDTHLPGDVLRLQAQVTREGWVCVHQETDGPRASKHACSHTAACVDGTLPTAIQVDNRSTVGVPYLEARLQQHLTLVAHHLFGHRTRRIAVTRALCR